VFALIAFIGDVIIRTHTWTAINSLIPLLTFSFLTYLTKKGVSYSKLIFPFVGASVFSVASTFFLFGGYEGGVVLIAISLIVGISIFSDRKLVRATVLFVISMLSVLFFLQKSNPDIVVAYTSADERFCDYLLSSVFSLAIVSIFIDLIVNRYRNYQQDIRKERETVLAQNAIIQNKNESLAELNKTKDKFFSIISHDLKNPLSTFKDGLKMLRQDANLLSKEDRDDIINTLSRNADVTYELLENLLAWSRIQTGRFPYHPEKFVLNGIISFNVSLMESHAKSKNIEIDYKLDDIYNVFADQNMISAVIRNLLSNAVKYTPLGGKISIYIYKGVQETRLTIEDNGIGMSEDKINELFKIDNTYSQKGTNGEFGTGLGLILCKEFIEKNSGKISVRSQAGKGSAFTITIPSGPLKIVPMPI
jgi:signal transduction histidine kinase